MYVDKLPNEVSRSIFSVYVLIYNVWIKCLRIRCKVNKLRCWDVLRVKMEVWMKTLYLGTIRPYPFSFLGFSSFNVFCIRSKFNHHRATSPVQFGYYHLCAASECLSYKIIMSPSIESETLLLLFSFLFSFSFPKINDTASFLHFWTDWLVTW